MKGRRARSLVFRSSLALILSSATMWAATSFPAGSYAAGDFTVTFRADGKLTVAQKADIVVEGTYKVNGTAIEMTDQSGQYACMDRTGRYNWKLQGDTLTFEKLSDDCEGRERVLTSQPLKRKTEKP